MLDTHIDISHVVWIDADAIVIDHNSTMERLIETADDRELILAENMNSGFLINAGVLIIKNSTWIRELLEEVWNCGKYFNQCFYEQSALLKAFKARKEGLLQISPFHSFEGGPSVKIFPHVYVYHHLELNSNRGWVFPKKSQRGKKDYSVHEGEAEDTCARFIFHAAGMRNKLSAIRGVLKRFDIQVPTYVAELVKDFRLFRNSIGGRATVHIDNGPLMPHDRAS